MIVDVSWKYLYNFGIDENIEEKLKWIDKETAEGNHLININDKK